MFCELDKEIKRLEKIHEDRNSLAMRLLNEGGFLNVIAGVIIYVFEAIFKGITDLVEGTFKSEKTLKKEVKKKIKNLID